MQQSIISQSQVFDGSKLRVGVVLARFNSDITEAMLETLIHKSSLYNIQKENIQVYRVPGAIEIPLVLKNLAYSLHFDCLVSIGCVIRGDTTHYDYVCKYITEGVLRVSLDCNIPIGFAVLTVENHQQAVARLDSGWTALEASIQTYQTIKSI